MRIVIPKALAGLAMIIATPAIAQQRAEPSVEGYLCVFAGKCGDGAAATAAASGESGVTEGFRIARPDAGGQKPLSVSGGAADASPAHGLVAKPPRGGAGRHHAVQPSLAAVAPHAGMGVQPAAGVGHADLMIGFKLNSAQITPDGLAKARIFAKALQMPELSAKRFLIEGHTDSRGNLNTNMDLSRRRAQAVADFLAQQGVEASRIDVRGFGPSQPLAGHVASDTRNRRVEARLAS